ncbi:hypothetical protein FQN53_006368 [Emmonsiellopsis sp. PD_33]|nr:hypothetical protein FQN53_006368 [Emmonsiellopsis sp. PD_33]
MTDHGSSLACASSRQALPLRAVLKLRGVKPPAQNDNFDKGAEIILKTMLGQMICDLADVPLEPRIICACLCSQ